VASTVWRNDNNIATAVPIAIGVDTTTMYSKKTKKTNLAATTRDTQTVATNPGDSGLAAEVPSDDQIGLQMTGETTEDWMIEEMIDGQTIIIGMIVVDLLTASGTVIAVITIEGTEKTSMFVQYVRARAVVYLPRKRSFRAALT
jgi:hypothetical protein